MKKKDTVNQTTGLPNYPEYRTLSKESIVKILLTNPKVKEYTYVDHSYCFNKNIVAIFNFEDKPICGKFACFIIDAKEGFILTKKSSKRMLNCFSKNHLLMNILFQKCINKLLKFKFYHAISVWQHAYFSIHGYTQKSSDWVGLHQMVDYECDGEYVNFKTVKIDGIQYTIRIKHGQKHFTKRINEAITHNSVLTKIIENTAYHHSWHLSNCKKMKPKTTLLTNEKYIIKHKIVSSDRHVLKEIIDSLYDIYFDNVINAINNEHDLGFNISDCQHIKRKAKRPFSIM